MNTLDWVILAVLGVGFIAGFIKGVIKQAFSLGGLVLGIICGTLLYKPFAALLLKFLKMSDQTALIVAFVIILLVVPIVCGLLGKALSKVVHEANLGFLDRLLGGVFGLFKYLIVMGLVFQLMDITGLTEKVVDRGERKQSSLYAPVNNITRFCLQWTWNKVEGTASDLMPDFQFKNQENSDKSDQKEV
jgi:membrane protein required for colicin V production